MIYLIILFIILLNLLLFVFDENSESYNCENARGNILINLDFN